MYSLRANPSNIATFLRILGEGKRLLCGAEGDSIGTNTLGRGETIRTGGLGLFARGGEVSLNSLIQHPTVQDIFLSFTRFKEPAIFQIVEGNADEYSML